MKKVRLFSAVGGLLGSELLIAALFFFFSPQGYTRLRDLEKQREGVEKETQQVRVVVRKLEEEIDNWKKYPFYKEKYCCEHLQMIYPQTITYLL